MEHLLYGFTHNGNAEELEKCKDKLVEYVKDNDEKAFILSDLVRKALNTDSKLGIMIMGYILVDIVNNKQEKATQEELILIKALSNTTDIDLRNFYYIYSNFKNDDDIIIFDIKDIVNDDIESFELTCDWCVYNRIFKLVLEADYKEENNWISKSITFDKSIKDKYLVTNIADKLYNFMNKLPKKEMDIKLNN